MFQAILRIEMITVQVNGDEMAWACENFFGTEPDVQSAYSIETFAWDQSGDLLIKTYYPIPEHVGTVTRTLTYSTQTAKSMGDPKRIHPELLMNSGLRSTGAGSPASCFLCARSSSLRDAKNCVTRRSPDLRPNPYGDRHTAGDVGIG
ncbi:hypothetical protein BST21_02320 [Mycolicibacterium celeriflavum]|nr:hypothetical protein BST21_02320 [Mycolicibacterium celeriflavum]